MKLYRFKNRHLRWFYLVSAPPLVALWLWTLAQGTPWYFIPTTVFAIVAWSYFFIAAVRHKP